MNRLLFIILGGLLAVPASGDIYQWTDGDGQVHYGGNPPPHVDARTLDGAPGPADSPDEPVVEGNRVADDAANPDDTADDKQSATDGVLAEACDDARHNAEVFADESVRRVRAQDGNLERLEPGEREERLAEARAFLDEHC